MDQLPLHRTKKNPIKKSKRILKPVPSKQELAALKECTHWKDKVRILQQVKRYQEKGEEQELKSLICNWRKVAQDVACKLACHFSKDEPFVQTSLWDDDQPRAIQPESAEADGAEDPMARMLALLHIDPDLIHYSVKAGNFYD